MIKVGDFFQQGIVNTEAINQAINVFNGTVSPTEEQKFAIDIDNNGIINTEDINGIINIFQDNTTSQIGNSFFSLKESQTKNNTMELYMDNSLFYTKNSTNKIAGIQLYVSGVQLAKRALDDDSSEGYLTVDEKHSSLENWIVACNTIKKKGVDEWNLEDLSIIYLEMDSDNGQLNTDQQGLEKLCELPYISRSGNIKMFNSSPYFSKLVDVTDTNVVEHKFIQAKYMVN